MSWTTSIRLAAHGVICPGALLGALRAHVVPGLERHDAATRCHTRVIGAPGGPAAVTVAIGPDAVHALVRASRPDDAGPLAATIRDWLDLDADTRAIDAALGVDPLLAPLVAARPGLRVLGSTDGAETAITAVLGQQVSLAAARTFGGRLVAAFGRPVGEGLTAFPPPGVLAAAGSARIRAATGVTGARARAVHALAEALRDGLRLDRHADRDAARAQLLGLPGIGPWTADCLAVRALEDPDAFAAGDLVLRRVLGGVGAREAAARAEAWRPWRAYALFHLWTAAAFVPAGASHGSVPAGVSPT